MALQPGEAGREAKGPPSRSTSVRPSPSTQFPGPASTAPLDLDQTLDAEDEAGCLTRRPERRAHVGGAARLALEAMERVAPSSSTDKWVGEV